jgi:leucyl-tRNA synthetase
MVEKFGADTLRAYIMFIGPYDQESAWNMSGIQGVHRFLKRVWTNVQKVRDNKDSNVLLVKLNQTIKGVTDDLENFQMNTVISKLMELNNVMEKEKAISKYSFEIFLKLLFPACPHIASELWENLGGNISIDQTSWPKFDEKYLVADEIEIAVQINGKTRAVIKMSSSVSQDQVEKIALADERVKIFLGNYKIAKTFYITGRIINFVVE